jgi:acyl-CoA synthetase (AMP-forming)/AMP-acid ligase II
MPRFDADRACELVAREGITFLPMVPPVMNALSHAAEANKFPKQHRVRYTKSGAAPLAPELPRRYTELTGIPVAQGYGMTEASPVTHVGFIEPDRYRPDTIGHPVAETQCRLLLDDGREVDVTTARSPDRQITGSPDTLTGELLMRGPQFMLGYLNAPEATAAVLRDGWYHSGDVARVDAANFFQIVDRRKEMIKYKGFPIAPAEVEACLLEHPKVRDVGVIGRPDNAAGELPVAFVVLRGGDPGSTQIADELSAWVSDRLTKYKQPREVRFVTSIPRNPSGKILRRDLRSLL